MRQDGPTDRERALGRRRFLAGTAAALAAGLAGCGGDGGNQSGQSFDGWMNNVGNYDEVVDRTGQDRVTVTVGAEGNGGNLAYAPAAVRIDTGTTVVWEWTGEGGQHNVVAESGASLESELVLESGHTYEFTFEEPGTTKYYCTPHETAGMKGVVVVE